MSPRQHVVHPCQHRHTNTQMLMATAQVAAHCGDLHSHHKQANGRSTRAHTTQKTTRDCCKTGSSRLPSDFLQHMCIRRAMHGVCHGLKKSCCDPTATNTAALSTQTGSPSPTADHLVGIFAIISTPITGVRSALRSRLLLFHHRHVGPAVAAR